MLCRQEAEEHERAMDALESALEEAKSQARSKEQKLLIATKELKVAEHCTPLAMAGCPVSC